MTETPKSSLEATQLAIVAGKGGVGKTVVSAAMAVAAARSGRDVTLVEVEGKAHLSALFGVASGGYESVPVLGSDVTGGGTVSVRTIGPDQALIEWLQHNGLGRIAKQFAKSGALEVVATATPGMKDLLVLGRVKQMFNESDDFVIIDAPASGHALSLLRSPAGLAETARVGVINRQARQVLEMLQDHDRTAVVLVGLAEETPVNELVETAGIVEELGIGLGPIVLNQLWDAPEALRTGARTAPPSAGRDAARFVVNVVDRQREALAVLDEAVDLPRIRLRLLDAEVGRPELLELADDLAGMFAR